MAIDAPLTGAAAGWVRHAGRRATVIAPPASFAATRAAQVLHEAERTATELEGLLGVPDESPPVTLDILLVDAAPPGAEPAGASPPAPALTLGAPPPLLRVISPEGTPEPLARAMTRALVAH